MAPSSGPERRAGLNRVRWKDLPPAEENSSAGGFINLPGVGSTAAWERWVRGERLQAGEVAPHVLESWERCRGWGLDPFGLPRPVVLSAEELARRRRRNQTLLTIAHHFMSELSAALPGCRFRVWVADPEGYKLECLGEDDLEISPQPGFGRQGAGENWSEAVHGTNAIGTALVMDAPVFLKHDEYFFACLRRNGWNSSAVPIRDSEGRTAAVLSLTGPAEELSLFAHGLNLAAAREIERELELKAATRRLEEQNHRLALLDDLERLLAEEAESEFPSPNLVVKLLGGLGRGRTVALLRYDAASGDLVTEASCPADPTLVPRRWAVTANDAVEQCLRSGRPALSQATLAQPILAGGTVIGLLLVSELDTASLRPEDLRLLEVVACRLSVHAERCRLYRELQAESGLRRGILEQMDAGIVIIDLVRGRLTWNRPMERYFATPGPSVSRPGELPRPDKVMKYPVQFAAGDLGELLRNAISSGETVVDEAVILANPPRTFRVTTGPVRGATGRVEYILQTYTDVTPYQRLEQRKGELVAMISHELRTPLTGIKGYAYLLGELCHGDEAIQKLLDGLLREIGELSALVERVVEVNRIELQPPFSFRPVSLRSVLQEVVKGLAGQAALRQVRLELTGPDLWVRGDRHALALVFTNLVHNAIKYSPDGETVTIRMAREGPAARVEVNDRGPGIPREYQEEIFNRFCRVPARETVNLPGSGLGLYIVRRLVERHGGEVKVDSRIDHGTTFMVILPEEVEEHGQTQDPRGG